MGSAEVARCGLELPAVAAALEMLPAALFEDPCPVRELVQVQVAAFVQLIRFRPARQPSA